MKTLVISKTQIKRNVKKATGTDVSDIEIVTRNGHFTEREVEDWLEELTEEDIENMVSNKIVKWWVNGG